MLLRKPKISPEAALKTNTPLKRWKQQLKQSEWKIKENA
jgi:hypothetical protein